MSPAFPVFRYVDRRAPQERGACARLLRLLDDPDLTHDDILAHALYNEEERTVSVCRHGVRCSVKVEQPEDHRYLPEREMSLRTRKLQRVTGYKAHPPGTHVSPIRSELTAVQCFLDTGESRWYGCDRAYIAADLRMVAVGQHDSRDEVRSRWERVAADLLQY